ncbi:MAG: radical SAM protein [Acidobacteriota bacterium]
MERFTCDWAFKTLVVLCDGKVVCGCADPRGERPVGDLTTDSVADVWNGPVLSEVRDGLRRGHAPFCLNCGIRRPLLPDEPVPQMEAPPMPQRAFIEPAVTCNISCYRAHCSREAKLALTRRQSTMDMATFTGIMQQMGESLHRLELFNYGETFVNAGAIDMIRMVKQRWPHVYLFVSTNGLLLDAPDKIAGLVESGADEITFSIDGSSPAVYERYRRGGDFNRAIKNMGALVAARNAAGRESPIVNWRYILFNWNDSDEEMNGARRMAMCLGVDRLCWEITDHPPGCASTRYAPGTSDYDRIRHEIWGESGLANALPDRRMMAYIRPPWRPLRLEAGRPVTLWIKVRNVGTRPWPNVTPTGSRFVRLGAQLLDHQRSLLDRDFARAFLPSVVKPAETVPIPLTLTPPPAPGQYVLKFDMVCEGVGWFEDGGSGVRFKNMRVKSP